MNLKTPILCVVALSLFAMTANAVGVPDPGMTIDLSDTALVVTDPQNDFLSPEGVTWGVVGKSVTENKTVEHIDTLFKTHAGSRSTVP